MSLGPRLDLRQSQSLVMTPQLQQAIKLLALSNLEIETFIGDALDANPLLEAGEIGVEDGEPAVDADLRDATSAEGEGALDIDGSAIDRDRDTGDGDAGWGAAIIGEGGGEAPDIEARGQGEATLAQHLEAQVGAESYSPREAAIARYIINLLDPAGYLSATIEEVAAAMSTTRDEAEDALLLVQSLDPTGVGARDLAECIALQAREANRCDPAMARLIDNLDLVGRGDIARLKRLCRVSDEDLRDMLAELRDYDPRPGLQFNSDQSTPIAPDILLARKGEGEWSISLNPETLPRLVVNRDYYVELRSACDDKASRSWLSEKLGDANWLIKALDQRQKTILKVATEVVKQQEGFFRHGVAHLKPLTLRAVAEAVEMHESTISRVTSNKYLSCARGTFELKYFFSSGVASTANEEGASAEAVKAAIRKLVENEDASKILSDDALVEKLQQDGFALARRTVAKYREAIGIGSSVQRRREKALAAAR